MIVSEIRLFQIAKEKFGEKTAEEFVQAIKQTVDEKLDESKSVLATKEDLAKIEVKMAEIEGRLTFRMFLFWMGQVAVVAGLLAYFFSIR